MAVRKYTHRYVWIRFSSPNVVGKKSLVMLEGKLAFGTSLKGSEHLDKREQPRCLVGFLLKEQEDVKN